MIKRNTRRAERCFAFQVLYGLSFVPEQNIESVRRAFCRSPDYADSSEASEPARTFAWELVQGVWSRDKELDELITRFSHNWRLSRVGRVELIILRLGLYEIFYREDVPVKVAINEAMELSVQFGEASARNFVKGILDTAAKSLENS